MRLIQFETADEKASLGVVEGERVLDVTSLLPECPRVLDLFHASRRAGLPLAAFIRQQLDQTRRPAEFSLSRAPGKPRPARSRVRAAAARPSRSLPFAHFRHRFDAYG